MTASGSEALEIALGLLRAPGLRTILRARPLPPGTGELLAIAAGSAERLSQAAARTGHPEARLVEASRFYVQQVLLAEGADAYRVLGAERDADHATLRDHHRLLMRWLHPDRSEDAQWDSVLSTRVNQAWNQLRTSVVRAEYDATLAQPHAMGTATAGRAAVGAALVASPIAPERRPLAAGPVTVALLALLCLVLAWFAITREDISYQGRAASAASSPAERPDTAEPAPVEASTDPVGAAMAAMSALAEQADPFETAQDAHRAPPAPAADLATPGRTVAVPAAATALAASPASSRMPATGDGADRTARAGDARAVPNRARVTTEATPAMTPTMAGTGAALATAGATAARKTSVVAAAAAPAKAISSAPPAPEDPLRLFLEAEDAIRGVTAYFVAEGGAEPLWLDLDTSLDAADIRSRLQARQQGGGRARMEIDSPNWRLGAGVASMSGAYRIGGRHGAPETGRLHVELARRDSQWRVAGVRLVPAGPAP